MCLTSVFQLGKMYVSVDMYHLKNDIEQKENLAKENPEKLAAMIAAYHKAKGNIIFKMINNT